MTVYFGSTTDEELIFELGQRGYTIRSNDDKVICPACVHEFPAIPVNVQIELAELRAFKEWVESQTMEWHLDGEAAGFLAGFINADDEPTSVNLKLGHIKDDDGKVSYGLLVLDAEYPEEGASLLVECAPPSPVNSELVKTLWDAYCGVAKISGSALLAGEKCPAEDKAALYRIALTVLNGIGVVYSDVTGEWPNLVAPHAALSNTQAAKPALTQEQADADIEYWRKKYQDLDKLYDKLEKETAAQANGLRKVLSVVQEYLPPDGIKAEEAIHRIIGIVDPWPTAIEITNTYEMHEILEKHRVKVDEYTDCASLYKVTFEQLRAIYDEGRGMKLIEIMKGTL